MDYKEKLKLAKDWYNDQSTTKKEKVLLENLFPELTESNSERIRREIIDYLHLVGKGDGDFAQPIVDGWLAWLEKQGDYNKLVEEIKERKELLSKEKEKAKSANDRVSLGGRIAMLEELLVFANEKQGEQKPANIEPKFHKGDMIIHKELGGDYIHNPHKIIQVDILDKEYRLEGGLVAHFSEEDDYELVEQKPADKVEPKFKVGDWVVDNQGKVNQISSTSYDGYGFCLYDGTYISGCWKDYYHLWTIKDAKDGDVLASMNGCPFIYKKSGGVEARFYCCVDFENCFCVGNGTSHCGFKDSSKPATKEQRDLLFTKMKEAGYEWDSDKKELRKIDGYCKEHCKGFQETGKCFADGECKAKRDAEQKPAWSEDDEKMMQCIHKYVKASASNFDYQNIQIWFRNLKNRVQSRWKPTKEQMNLLEEVQQALLGKDCKNLFKTIKTLNYESKR